VGLANLGSELETCVGSRVCLVGVSISFEKNFYRLPFTPPLVHRIGPSWRAAAGEQFPSEDVKEQVVFASFFEHGFNLPAGDFFRGLLYYYQLELVHHVPNSITVVSTFIHLCEAYLGISPHFLLWRYFFYVKSTGKRSGPVRAVMFNLRPGLKAEWIDTDLPDNTAEWRSEWF
jgi:hypothetical protein